MYSRFVATLLLTWFTLPLWASEWVERKNQELDPNRPLGWSFEVPPAWRQVSVPQFPYPLGESWTGGEGRVEVCWLGQSTSIGIEQFNLEERGYERSQRRVAGRDAVAFQKGEDLFAYVNTPKGVCRLHLSGSNPLQQKILQSFNVIQLAKVAVSPEQRYADWSFQPPPGWTFRAPDLVMMGEEPVCRLSSHSLTRDLMLRGWARNQASQDNPTLTERLGMEPYSSKHGVDGYLVEWKGAKGPLLFGYAAREQKGLRLELLKSSEVDRLRRLIDTLRYQPQ